MKAVVESNQFVTLANGIRLHYASAGKPGAPLLLFLHGFPECWLAWESQLAEFGDDYFAVAPDLRGFNLSDMPHDVSAYRHEHLVEDIRLLALHLGYEKCVLVGHDWGGVIAWHAAIALPQLVRKLIIINAPHPYLFLQALAHDPAQQSASVYMNWLRGEAAEAVLAANDFAHMDGIFNGMGLLGADWYNAELRDKYHACWSHGLSGALNYYRASPMHPPTDTEPGPTALTLDPLDFVVQVPTRVIWGEDDRALPTTLLHGLDALVPNLRIERIEEGTHWIIHEQPGRISRLIREYLNEVA